MLSQEDEHDEHFAIPGGNVEFRSLLPHELPYYKREKQQEGYVLIQGSLLPKKKQQQQQSVDTVVPCIQRQLLHYFSHNVPSSVYSNDIKVVVVVVDHINSKEEPAAATVTRARICYPNEKEARHVFLYLKHFQTSPQDIFGKEYSNKPLQVTQVTSRPLLSLSWPFASPPKFRRLLITTPTATKHDDDDDDVREHMAQVKTSTRYLYISGIEPALSKLRERLLLSSSSSTNGDVVVSSAYGVVAHTIAMDAIREWILSQISSTAKDNTTLSEEFVEVWMPNSSKSSTSTTTTTITQKQQPVKYCYVGVSSHLITSHLVQQLLGKSVLLTFSIPSWLLNEYSNTNGEFSSEQQPFVIVQAQTDPLFLDWADANRRIYNNKKKNHVSTTTTTPRSSSCTKPECTSTSAHVHVPGLFVLPNFLSEEEEHVLLASVTGPFAPWAPSQKTPTNLNGTGCLRRRVQHYGYVFDYASAHIQIEAFCPPLPAVAAADSSNNSVVASHFMNDSVKQLRGWDVFAGILERVRRIEIAALPNEEEEVDNNEPRQHTVAAADDDVAANDVDLDHQAIKNNNTSNTTTAASSTNNLLLLNHNGYYYNEYGDGAITKPTTTILKSATTRSTLLFKDVNQVTVNEYIPGSGIGSHIDTETAFGDGIISISLKGCCTMEFREQQEGRRRRKLVYLPPRSLLVMCNDARYRWEHHIVSRSTDTVDGKVIPRSTRISLTLRTALPTTTTTTTTMPLASSSGLIKSLCIPLPRIERSYYNNDSKNTSNGFNPSHCYNSLIHNKNKQNNDQQQKQLSDDGASSSSPSNSSIVDPFVTPATERTHVHNVYDAIATQWNHTRGKRNVIWPGATNFIQSLVPSGSLIADVGCGDGKYFETCQKAGHFVIGTDISIPLLFTSKRIVDDTQQQQHQYADVVGADCIHMPFVSSRFDAVLCIAVMHHLSTVARRKQCLRELRRILVNGGIVMIQAWALEQEKDSRHSFGATDVLVPFNAQPRYLKPTTTTNVLVDDDVDKNKSSSSSSSANLVVDVAEAYANMYFGAQFDSEKGLVVFQRYCHVYRQGELDELILSVGGWEILDSGYECGNHYIIARSVLQTQGLS